MANKKISFSEIKKYLEIKGLNISKKKKNNDLRNNNLEVLLRTFLSSIIIISFFVVTPIVIEFNKKSSFLSKENDNNSSINFKKTLKGEKFSKSTKAHDTKIDDIAAQQYLFNEVSQYEDLPSDTVRLSASTIEQLFKDTNYQLEDVRKNKLVKPVSLSLLPEEMKMIESSTKRKELFIQIILPLVIKENNNIKLDRRRLFVILNKSSNSTAEKNWLREKFKKYGVANQDMSTLKIRMDEIPTSLAIAQAAKETGWGTSRFAQEGNALFGQWTWTGEGIKPKGAETNSTHKVMKFKVLQASVKAYHRNLNTHSSYREFRKARADLRDKKRSLDSISLSKHLNRYAETGEKYVEILQKIIKQNKLTDFDDAKLLPSSIELESLI